MSERTPHDKSLDAGAEAASGIRNTSDTEGETSRGGERSGSEPLTHDREHKGSYGGEGGAPRTSSNEREPTSN